MWTLENTIESAGRKANVTLVGEVMGCIMLAAGKFLSMVKVATHLDNAVVNRLLYIVSATQLRAGQTVSVLGQLAREVIDMPYIVAGTDNQPSIAMKNGEPIVEKGFLLEYITGNTSVFNEAVDSGKHTSRCVATVDINQGFVPAPKLGKGAIVTQGHLNADFPLIIHVKSYFAVQATILGAGGTHTIIGHVESDGEVKTPKVEGQDILDDQGQQPKLFVLKPRIVVDTVPTRQFGNYRRNFGGTPTNVPAGIAFNPNTQLSPTQSNLLAAYSTSQV